MNQDLETQDRHQRLFDRVWKHFVVDGNPPSYEVVNDDVMCRYRGPNGCRCGVGILIPDEEYDAEIESTRPFSTDEFIVMPAWRAIRSLSILDRDFLQAIQTCHDVAVEPDDPEGFTARMRESMERMANAYELNIPV